MRSLCVVKGCGESVVMKRIPLCVSCRYLAKWALVTGFSVGGGVAGAVWAIVKAVSAR